MARRASGKSDRAASRDARRRTPAELLEEVIALDRAPDDANAESRRAALEAEAATAGMRLTSVEIIEDPIPDPDIEAMAPADRARLEAIAQRLFEDGASQVAALEDLRSRYAHIPTIWNYLAVALEDADEHDRAVALVAETAERFPEYLFGVCNHARQLLEAGDLDGAREILETGPLGQRLSLTAMCPGRTRFHITEAMTLAFTAAHFLALTDRMDAALVQLEMLQQLAPDHPTTQALEEDLEILTMAQRLAGAEQRIGRKAKRRSKKRSKKQSKKRSSG